jgi:YhcH/YjgK/YiaL family protein
MIIGAISQTNLTDFLEQSPVLRRAFDWIRALPAEPADGITELDGRDLYANVHGYTTHARAACQWESHRHTADLQYVFDGGELIDWTPGAPTEPAVAYDVARDFVTWPATIALTQTVALTPGTFVIFLPGELHRPAIVNGRDAAVRKLVVKIHARLLRSA